MITDKKGKEWMVVAFTPAGRKYHLEVLKTYIDKENIIDEWQLWLNTGKQDDIDYIKSVEGGKIVVKDIGLKEQNNYNISKFYKFLDDKDTIYLRLDDDMVYIHPDAVKNLLECRLENTEPFVVFANIVNNAVISNIHQRIGILSREFGDVTRDRYDPINFLNLDFVKLIHRTFIKNYETPEKYYFEDERLTDNKGFSINCFAMFGEDVGEVASDEELHFSVYRPNELNRPNMVCGNALVVHFAFNTQRKALNEEQDIVEFYKNICQN